ncbi:PadR family transcriptional regulator [Singulisphaera sp. Ch08]|uniref:PadR family transcriptional regulator n=1 Tax=Singulisphaera sp. Ch08 TaxID=3120278 RepID=A0AAU7CJL9_9BACT
MRGWDAQLRRGVVELAVMAAIERGETYGYRIVEQLRELPGLEFTESTVYPVLTRLAGEGMIAVRSEASRSGPPRRYYRLTEEGRMRMVRMAAGWTAMAGSMARLLEGAT